MNMDRDGTNRWRSERRMAGPQHPVTTTMHVFKLDLVLTRKGVITMTSLLSPSANTKVILAIKSG